MELGVVTSGMDLTFTTMPACDAFLLQAISDTMGRVGES
jgi:hypothetical protein